MEDKKKEEHFIRIRNEFITEGEKHHLTEGELYLWSILYRDSNIDAEIRTTIATLSAWLPVKFNSRYDREVKQIKATLISLKDKGLITSVNKEGEVISDKWKANDPMLISIVKTESVGFVKMPFAEFNKSFKTMSDYYIFCCIARWNNGNAKYSLSRWQEMLNCNRDTVIKKLNDAIANGKIYKNTGDYIKGEKKQEVNEYSTKPFDSEKKSNITIAKEIEEANEKYRAENRTYEHTLDEEEMLTDNINIFKTYKDEFGISIFPCVDDYVFYLEIEDELKSRPASNLEAEFIKVAKRRMKQLENNPKFQEAYEEALDLFENGEQVETHSMEVKPVEVCKKVDVIPENVHLLF